MNIEHEFFDRSGRYESFEGICFVDTFELSEPGFLPFEQKNASRIERQKAATIKVVIGNPPYRLGQKDENDNNKNRKYPVLDTAISESYARGSAASLKTKYRDAYIRAIKFATERLSDSGIIAFITNSGFIDDNVYDGIRKHLAQDFESIYLLDLGGNTVKNPKLSGTTHNVFGIPRGVSINFFVRNQHEAGKGRARIWYCSVDEFWRKEQKLAYLEQAKSISGVDFEELTPDKKYTWLTEGMSADFEGFIPLGSREAKKKGHLLPETIFSTYSLGVSTNRDRLVYNFDGKELLSNVAKAANVFNSEVTRWRTEGRPSDPGEIDEFAEAGAEYLKWSHFLKQHLVGETSAKASSGFVRHALYRPFCSTNLHFDSVFVDAPGLQRQFFPKAASENRAIFCSDKGFRAPFSALAVNALSDLHLCASEDGFQSFPFYLYNEDGTNQRENVTDWALERFQTNYGERKITKWDIFHYLYALLHHPAYRERYEANLKRDLPRVPYAAKESFWPLVKAGKRLMEIHVAYESQPEYKSLKETEKPGAKDKFWRVEKMKLSKDKTTLIYNEFLTLGDIPPAVYEYRLGNRSALEWIVDQYQVSTDKRSGIVNDPNREDDPKYIYKLIKKVITVSVETVEIVKGLPDLGLPDDKGEAAKVQ